MSEKTLLADALLDQIHDDIHFIDDSQIWDDSHRKKCLEIINNASKLYEAMKDYSFLRINILKS